MATNNKADLRDQQQRNEIFKTLLTILFLSTILPYSLTILIDNWSFYKDQYEYFGNFFAGNIPLTRSPNLTAIGLLADFCIIFPYIAINWVNTSKVKLYINTCKRNSAYFIVSIVFIISILAAYLKFFITNPLPNVEWPFIWICLLILILKKYYLFLTDRSTKKLNETQPILLNDQPLEKLQTAGSEYRKYYADSLVEIITKQDEKYISIAINGDWGSGKTSLLNEIEIKLEQSKTTHIMFLDFWALKEPQNIILELDRQFVKFFDSVYYNIKFDQIKFFKILLSDQSFWSDALDLISFSKTETFEDARDDLQKKIKQALKDAKKDRIVIFFDNIDRVINKEYLNCYFKTICSLINLEYVVAVSAIDYNRLSNLLQKQSEETYSLEERLNAHNDSEAARIDAITEKERKNLESSGAAPTKAKYWPNKYFLQNHSDEVSFLHKVYNLICDLPEDLKSSQKMYLNDINKKIDEIFQTFLLFENNDDIVKKLKQAINDCLDISAVNYRDIKVLFNEVIYKLKSMQNNRPKLHLLDLISVEVVVALSYIKIISPELYYKIKNHTELSDKQSSDKFIQVVLDFFNNEIGIDKDIRILNQKIDSIKKIYDIYLKGKNLNWFVFDFYFKPIFPAYLFIPQDLREIWEKSSLDFIKTNKLVNETLDIYQENMIEQSWFDRLQDFISKSHKILYSPDKYDEYFTFIGLNRLFFAVFVYHKNNHITKYSQYANIMSEEILKIYNMIDGNISDRYSRATFEVKQQFIKRLIDYLKANILMPEFIKSVIFLTKIDLSSFCNNRSNTFISLVHNFVYPDKDVLFQSAERESERFSIFEDYYTLTTNDSASINVAGEIIYDSISELINNPVEWLNNLDVFVFYLSVVKHRIEEVRNMPKTIVLASDTSYNIEEFEVTSFFKMLQQFDGKLGEDFDKIDKLVLNLWFDPVLDEIFKLTYDANQNTIRTHLLREVPQKILCDFLRPYLKLRLGLILKVFSAITVWVQNDIDKFKDCNLDHYEKLFTDYLTIHPDLKGNRLTIYEKGSTQEFCSFASELERIRTVNRKLKTK